MRIGYKHYKVLLSGLLGFILVSGISACHRNLHNTDSNDPKLPCKVQGACDKTITKFISQLNGQGVKVITMGQEYMISIPARALFANQSPRLTWHSYALLNNVALFLRQFRKVDIYVTSFSSKYISVQRERALTLARSRAVGDYLWSRGVDSRFIFTQGLGSDKPIVSSLAGGDNSQNARVEIVFRRAVA